jgi:hypothetical protein
MSNSFSDILFQLVKTLEKSEKRHFKLYIKRSSAKQELKIVQLFDALDKMDDYDEAYLLKRLKGITKPQLANLKNHLYKEVLASLRLLRTTDTVDLQLSEHLDNARLLYNKGLKIHALKILEKSKEVAKANQKYNFLVQALSLEKKIETLHITRSSLEKTETLSHEASWISEHIERVTKLSNLALLLYRWYVKNGHARNETDEQEIKQYFKENLSSNIKNIFYEKLYLYQSYTWYAFIRQDFLMYYRYSQKWIDLYDEEPQMITVETGHYVKGIHNLMNAHFDLRNFREFKKVLKKFEAFSKTKAATQHDNFRAHTIFYISIAKINWHLMRGTFKEGAALIPEIEEKINENALYVDAHRILVFNYKFAMLHFGNGDYNHALDYLHKIIHGSSNLRADLQSYARLLHLMAHFELGNYEILESLAKSVYRFMAKMKNLTVVEEEIIKFIRHSFGILPKMLKPELEKFLHKIKHLEKNRYETRAFAYFDVISWVESKVYEKSLSEIIHQKYLKNKRK